MHVYYIARDIYDREKRSKMRKDLIFFSPSCQCVCLCLFVCLVCAAMKQRKLYEETLYILASEASEVVAAAAEAATNTRHQTVITTTNHVCSTSTNNNYDTLTKKYRSFCEYLIVLYIKINTLESVCLCLCVVSSKLLDHN